MKKIRVDIVFSTLIKCRGKFLQIRNEWLEKRIQQYRDDYYIAHHRKPEEIEIKKFKKDIMMQLGLMIYLPAIVLLFILWLSMNEGGVFG